MKILIVYPGPVHSTFDVAAGYDEALRNAGQTVAAFPLHKYIAFYEGAYSYWGRVNPELEPDALDAMRAAAERMVIDLIDFAPDVVLVVEGLALHERAYALAQRVNAKLVLLLTESPYLDARQGELIREARAVAAFTNERTSAAPLAEQTGIPVHYLPHAFDPEIHRPQDVGEIQQSDVFFFGTLWPERRLLLDGLRDLPYRVQVGGYTLGEPMTEASFMANAAMARLYCGTKIALNHYRRPSPGGDATASPVEPESIGPRAYEIAACGAFQLSDHRAELVELFGDSVPVYAGIDDLRDKIAYYLSHDAQRLELARRARERVAGCTFESRAREILLPVLEGLVGSAVHRA